jgi:hypothetical protein
MKLFEDNTQVFIIRIWFERREIEGAAEPWRGVIEHMPSGGRCYVTETGAILDFMTSYLLEERNASSGIVIDEASD